MFIVKTSSRYVLQTCTVHIAIETMNAMPDFKALTKQAIANLRFEEPLTPSDPRLTDLSQVRGEFQESRLLYQLGILEADDPLSDAERKQYLLYGGHRGCGKSTALRQLKEKLHQSDRFFVVFIDALEALDINNLRYSDVVLAQAKGLFDALQKAEIQIDKIYLDRLEQWFDQRILSKTSKTDFAASIEGGVNAKGGIPWLADLFVKLQSAIKTNSTYKDEIRTEVRNHFSDFADAFNLLIRHAEEQIIGKDLGKRLLFIVDGTDRLRGEDAERFFVSDIYQLQQIESIFVYCVPVTLLSEHNLHGFEAFRLPMIKLSEKSTSYVPSSAAAETLKQLISKRMSMDLFEDTYTVDYLIEHSGGHVRDLIRLMRYALREAQSKQVTREMAVRSVEQLATEYSRLIEQDDYKLLVEIDSKPADYVPVSKQTRRLLYDLVLLEYNSYWWQTHPVVRSLPAYRRALQEAGNRE